MMTMMRQQVHFYRKISVKHREIVIYKYDVICCKALNMLLTIILRIFIFFFSIIKSQAKNKKKKVNDFFWFYMAYFCHNQIWS